MDMRTLKHLIHLVSVSNVGEVEIAEQDQKLRVVKAHAAHAVSPDWPRPSGLASAATSVVTAGAADGQAAANMGKVPEPPAVRHVTEAGSAPRTGHRQVVTSPMVGRFYCGTGPAAKMGIKLGAQVRAGEPLCMIEALKIPTLIEAARNGRIAEIFCQNGEAVEYGQPLLIIE